jgi:hypothetical protein
MSSTQEPVRAPHAGMDAVPHAVPPPMPRAAAVGRLLTAAAALADAGRAPPPEAVREVAQALGRAAARAGLCPDSLFARIEDAIHDGLARAADPDASDPARRRAGDADALVLLLWGGARDTYHDARAALDAAARVAGGRLRRELPEQRPYGDRAGHSGPTALPACAAKATCTRACARPSPATR